MLTRAGVSAWPFASAKCYFRVDQYSNKIGRWGRKIHSLDGDRTGALRKPVAGSGASAARRGGDGRPRSGPTRRRQYVGHPQQSFGCIGTT
jgi:hypothetical protein